MANLGVTVDGYVHVDLNSRLIKNKAASYLYWAEDDNIEHVGKGNILLVDHSIPLQPEQVVVVGYQGQHLLRRFIKHFNTPLLVADKGSAPPIVCSEEIIFKGVVRNSIYSMF